MAESKPISDKEVNDLLKQGFQEGDTVPGRGRLSPSGTFITEDAPTNIAETAGLTGGGSSKTTTTTKTGGTGTTDPFLDQLQQKLLGQAGIISSGQTGLEAKIQEAISGVSKSQEASAAGLEIGAERAISGVREAGAQKLTSARESQRGFGVNRAALKQITDETQKSVRDLEGRKQELILSGEAAAASKIAELQFSALEFQQQAMQQTFSNLLQVGGFAIEKSRESRLQAAQTSQEKQQIASIALEFGLPVTEGETLDTIVAKASPFATEQQRLKMQKTRAEIARIQAETQKALAGQDFAFDQPLASSIANTLNNLLTSTDPFAAQSIEAILGNVVDKHGASALEQIKREQESLRNEQFSSDNLRSDISEDIQSGASRRDISDSIESNQLMNPEQREEATNILNELSPRQPSLLDRAFTDIGDTLFGSQRNR